MPVAETARHLLFLGRVIYCSSWNSVVTLDFMNRIDRGPSPSKGTDTRRCAPPVEFCSDYSGNAQSKSFPTNFVINFGVSNYCSSELIKTAHSPCNLSRADNSAA